MKLILSVLFVFSVSQSTEVSQSLFKKHGLTEDSVSFFALNTDTGEVLADHNAESARPLASVTKLLSLYYSLSVLGPDKRFKTKLSYSGKIENGTLLGDLYLKGGGDPNLTPSQLMNLAFSMKATGIQKIKGKFYFDDKALIKSARLCTIGLEDQPDNPSVGALNVDFNRFRVFKNKELLPGLEHLKIKPSNKSLKADLNYSFLPKKNMWIKSSKAKKKYIQDLPARDAGLFTASYFSYLASLLGVEIPTPIAGKEPSDTKLIQEHKGLPLWRISSLAFEYSNNIRAELPAMMATQKITERPAGIKDSAKSVLSFLRTSFPKAGFQNTQLVNSSGLAINNKASAKTLAQFLDKTKDTKFGSRSFWSLFSINGRSGWISKRLLHPSTAYRVWAKTGSLYYVSNIAGYYLTSKGERVAFAILIHDSKARKILETPLTKDAENLRRKAKLWSAKTKSFTDQLLLSWLK
ncbi:MAG: hypothetical protein CME64_11405 [Halobacteriovoraceae bacterium]|nr:hypothetical protein [Halobacteriovoraceae bacterium]